MDRIYQLKLNKELSDHFVFLLDKINYSSFNGLYQMGSFS
jgi:hypothetical protein